MHQFIFNLRQNHIRTCSEVPWFYIATGEEYDASNHTPRVENSKSDFCQGLPGVFPAQYLLATNVLIPALLMSKIHATFHYPPRHDR